MKELILVYGLLNIMTFILYGVDKLKAMKGKYRISEKTLLVFALFSPFGAIAGMKLFHHKINKSKFKVAVPLFILLHIILIIGEVYYG